MRRALLVALVLMVAAPVACVDDEGGGAADAPVSDGTADQQSGDSPPYEDWVDQVNQTCRDSATSIDATTTTSGAVTTAPEAVPVDVETMAEAALADQLMGVREQFTAEAEAIGAIPLPDDEGAVDYLAQIDGVTEVLDAAPADEDYAAWLNEAASIFAELADRLEALDEASADLGLEDCAPKSPKVALETEYAQLGFTADEAICLADAVVQAALEGRIVTPADTDEAVVACVSPERLAEVIGGN